MKPGSEESLIFDKLSDTIEIDRKGRPPTLFDLSSRYRELKKKYFNGSIPDLGPVPDLSQDFVCTFQELPYDAAGATLLGEEAKSIGVKEGIRINEKFQQFPSEATVALLHEMIHASGLKGHAKEFEKALNILWERRAYLEPLIL